MQPTYLPWSGYFNLINSVDDFVFLDDVQFERRSWQSRNRILLDGKEFLLSVPIRNTGRDTKIADIEIDDNNNWRDHHIKVLTAAYRNAPFGDVALQTILPCLASKEIHHLATLNIFIINSVCATLDLSRRLHRASDLDCSGERSKHLALICDRLDTNNYLTPPGAMIYLEGDNFSSKYKKILNVQQFNPKPYDQQKVKKFISHLSIVDVIAHLGPEQSKEYITCMHP